MNTMVKLVKRKNTRIWGIGAMAVLIVALLAAQLLPTTRSSAQTATEATVVSIKIGETVQASGALAAQPFANLAWKTDGVVEKVNVKPGNMVKAGDSLLTLNASSVSSSIVGAEADLIQAQQDLLNLQQSNTARAQAAIDLQTAQDAYTKAADYRTSLNGETWLSRITYVTVRGRQVPVAHYYKGYADSTTLANADRDLALKMAQLEDAQRAYDRLKDGPNAADIAAAQAKVDAAQATVNMMSVIAPFDGEVLSVENQPGDVVSSGDMAVHLANLGNLYVKAQVDESDIAKVKLGNTATATVDALPGVTLTGKVTSIDPVGQSDSGIVKYNVRVEFDKPNTSATIPLGSTANVVIQVKEPTATLAVPITAVKNDSSGEYVLVVQSDGSTRRVDVVSGTIQGNLVTVTGNLHEGERLSTQSTGTTQQRRPGGFFGGGG